jgi:hypothetical protein
MKENQFCTSVDEVHSAADLQDDLWGMFEAVLNEEDGDFDVRAQPTFTHGELACVTPLFLVVPRQDTFVRTNQASGAQVLFMYRRADDCLTLGLLAFDGQVCHEVGYERDSCWCNTCRSGKKKNKSPLIRGPQLLFPPEDMKLLKDAAKTLNL